jgi:hypothetical protein
MGRWKPLPSNLPPQVRQLIIHLRELKDRAGISTVALARKTAYSRSSWERYLNGRTFPPKQAVEALARVCGHDPSAALALWELAQHARTGPGSIDKRGAPTDEPVPASASARTENCGMGRAVTQAVTASEASTQGPPRQLLSWWIPAKMPHVAVLAAVSVLTALLTAIWTTGHDRRSATYAPAPQSVAVRPSGYRCDIVRRHGELFAGYSDTFTRLVAVGSAGQDVAEVQCLLKHHGHTPGRIDGLFGRHTYEAVEDLQRAGNAGVDGVVGPQTWALLRR